MILIETPLKLPKGRRMLMTRVHTIGAILIASAVASAASAEDLRSTELHPVEAKSLPLGEVSGIAYFTVQGQGYRLIVTLAGLGGTPVRLVSTLLPGQEVAISAASSAGVSARTIQFSRQGDHLVVATKPKSIE